MLTSTRMEPVSSKQLLACTQLPLATRSATQQWGRADFIKAIYLSPQRMPVS